MALVLKDRELKLEGPLKTRTFETYLIAAVIGLEGESKKTGTNISQIDDTHLYDSLKRKYPYLQIDKRDVITTLNNLAESGVLIKEHSESKDVYKFNRDLQEIENDNL